MSTTNQAMSSHEGRFEPLNERLLALLEECAVAAEQLDAGTVRFRAVPVGDQFNKPRSNLLLRCPVPHGGSFAFVDSDLEYQGTDPARLAAFNGPCQSNWRRLNLPRLSAGLGEALASVLDLLASPLQAAVNQLLDRSSRPQQRELGRLLSSVAERITPQPAALAYERSFRKELAAQLAILTSRPTLPRCALLWGESGCGRDHLMLAAAHPLLERSEVRSVLRVPAARVAATSWLPAEVDNALMQLLGEATVLEASLLLVEDLDLCVTGSPVSYALLSNALDRGLRLLATVRSENMLIHLRQHDAALARRIVAIRVEPPGPEDLAAALNDLAKISSAPVSPAAVQTVLRLAVQHPAHHPAAALGWLGAAIAEAAWRGSPQVGPDDVFAGQIDTWPQSE